MKKILIYGDSNVWGDNSNLGRRIDDSKQWVNILKSKINDEWIVYQEGLPGRIAGNDRKDKLYKNGKDTFISTFMTNAPVDILVVALGTNDLQVKYNKSSSEIYSDLIWYTNILKEYFEEDKIKYFNFKIPDIYYLMPINFDNVDNLFDDNSQKKRLELIEYFKNNNCNVIVPNDVTLSDGIHLDYDGHKYIAELIYTSIFKN